MTKYISSQAADYLTSSSDRSCDSNSAKASFLKQANVFLVGFSWCKVTTQRARGSWAACFVNCRVNIKCVFVLSCFLSLLSFVCLFFNFVFIIIDLCEITQLLYSQAFLPLHTRILLLSSHLLILPIFLVSNISSFSMLCLPLPPTSFLQHHIWFQRTPSPTWKPLLSISNFFPRKGLRPYLGWALVHRKCHLNMVSRKYILACLYIRVYSHYCCYKIYN